MRQQEQQGKLLGDLSNGLTSFAEDLQKAGNFDDTLVLVFSEFGRRVTQNASNGTDHGTANNVLLVGGGLQQRGIITRPPTWPTCSTATCAISSTSAASMHRAARLAGRRRQGHTGE